MSEKAKVSKILGPKKVWTKLNNGLFGWRKMPTAKRRCKQSAASPRSRRCRGSAIKRNTSVSTSPTSEKEKQKTKELHSSLVAKEAEFYCCGTAQDCVGLDGLNFSCRPGHSSDFKANNKPANKFEFGREENNAVRGSRPRLFLGSTEAKESELARMDGGSSSNRIRIVEVQISALLSFAPITSIVILFGVTRTLKRSKYISILNSSFHLMLSLRAFHQNLHQQNFL